MTYNVFSGTLNHTQSINQSTRAVTEQPRKECAMNGVTLKSELVVTPQQKQPLYTHHIDQRVLAGKSSWRILPEPSFTATCPCWRQLVHSN